MLSVAGMSFVASMVLVETSAIGDDSEVDSEEADEKTEPSEPSNSEAYWSSGGSNDEGDTVRKAGWYPLLEHQLDPSNNRTREIPYIAGSATNWNWTS
jgi:hypothetical protein